MVVDTTTDIVQWIGTTENMYICIWGTVKKSTVDQIRVHMERCLMKSDIRLPKFVVHLKKKKKEFEPQKVGYPGYHT